MKACAGLSFDEGALDVVFSTFDTSRRGALDLTEFLALVLFIKRASGIFHVFDQAQRGSVLLDWSQFIYAAAFCL